MDNRTAQLLPLGYHRLRLLGCLGGDLPNTPGYFEPEVGMTIFESFRLYVDHLSNTWESETDTVTISLLAAASLLTGTLEAAETIIEHLPRQNN